MALTEQSTPLVEVFTSQSNAADGNPADLENGVAAITLDVDMAMAAGTAVITFGTGEANYEALKVDLKEAG